MKLSPATLVLLIAVGCTQAQTSSSAYAEFGRVAFERDYAKALERAKKENKPLFILFDELPG